MDSHCFNADRDPTFFLIADPVPGPDSSRILPMHKFLHENILYVGNNIGSIKKPFERSKFRLICFLFSFHAPGSESHIPNKDPYSEAKSMRIRIHNTVHQ